MNLITLVTRILHSDDHCYIEENIIDHATYTHLLLKNEYTGVLLLEETNISTWYALSIKPNECHENRRDT